MTTNATAIAGRLRQISARNHLANRARSGTRVAGRIYAQANVVYLEACNFMAEFLDDSLLVVSPAGPAVPRGRAKAHTLARVRQLPPEAMHRPFLFSDSTKYEAIKAIYIGAASRRGLTASRLATVPRTVRRVIGHLFYENWEQAGSVEEALNGVERLLDLLDPLV